MHIRLKNSLIVLILILFAVSACDRSAARVDPDGFAANYQSMDWEQIREIADGQTVYWYMWGGSEAINSFVTDYLGERLLSEYNVTLVLVPIADTADAVNKILADKQAGNDTNGSVDLVWINGENFRTLREGDVLFGPFAQLLPNRKFIAADSPALSYDYSFPVEDYESPYGAAQFVLIYNADMVPNPPRSMTALVDWIVANPGRFTYPLIPDFVGSVFIRHIFYTMSGDIDILLQPFNDSIYQRVATATWATLNKIEPYLWRSGQTYPESQAKLEQLFADGEVFFDISYNPAKGGTLVDSGKYPPTTRSYVFDEGTISNFHYVAIPYNALHKAGAMVLANLILDPAAQLEKSKPEVWGDPTVLSLETVPKAIRQQFYMVNAHPSAASAQELNKGKLPELSADWVTAIEKDWTTEVLQK